MLNIQNLSYLQGGIPLLQNVNLQAFANQRIGLVGKNGCGKSTLFRLIRGEIKPDGGEVSMQSGKTIAFVEQEIANSDQPALEFVLDGDAELRLLEKTLARENHDTAWFDAQHRYEAIDGYGAKARAAQLLNGLGFANDTLERPVTSFSGGWRMRLNLARALMHRADLLLLDEPTNHLDLEAILWLEQYLAHYPGSILLVSHDREFLNTCVNRIAHVHDQTIDSYTGDYDDFERTRAERIAQQNQAFERQQEKIAHMEDFVRRFRAQATKAKQAQSRIKALERITRIAAAHVTDGHFELEIEAPERSPDLLLRAEKMGFAYGDKTLFKNIELVLRAGARIALLGPNGAGKSTLIKLLVGELHPTFASATSPSINWKIWTVPPRRYNTWNDLPPKKPRWRCALSSGASAWPETAKTVRWQAFPAARKAVSRSRCWLGRNHTCYCSTNPQTTSTSTCATLSLSRWRNTPALW
jgi:ATP-binding cassette subfamily F protein 3